MKVNLDKCHLLLSTSRKVRMSIRDLNIINSKSANLLGITIVILVFSLQSFKRKDSSKIHALGRAVPYLNISVT